MMLVVEPGGTLRGEVSIPGDKSISHRALILSSLAQGESSIEGFLFGEDCLATLKALTQLGIHFQQQDNRITVEGHGLQSFSVPTEALDCQNSGTSMRLLAGLLSAQPFSTTLIGDRSLMKRPMARIITPLQKMGANIQGHVENQQILPPLQIDPCQGLQGMDYEMPIASAQVKSCILLAGLYAEGQTVIVEKEASRDHTERMLAYLGAAITQQNQIITLNPAKKLTGRAISIPGDISSAAFFIAGASMTEGAHVLLKGVGINPTRLGICHILRAMGAKIDFHHERVMGNEPVADIEITGGTLHGITVPKEWVVSAIDEFPVLFVVAACAIGETRFEGLQELRHKETDRIAAMANGLQKLGVALAILPDGIIIRGSKIEGGIVDSEGDHRVAMAFAIASMKARAPITIRDTASIATSFPSFCHLANQLGLRLHHYSEESSS